MHLSETTVLALTAAAALVFWPQISSLAKKFFGGGFRPSPSPSGRISRSQMVVQAMTLQSAAKAANMPKAAATLGEAAIELINEVSPPKATQNKAKAK